MNLLFNFFDGSHEEIMGKKQKDEVLSWNVGKRRWRGGTCKNPMMHDGPMETVEYMWVNIWCTLDRIIGFCHKTANIHFLSISCSTSECTKWDAVMASRDEVCGNSKPLQGLTFDGITWWNEDLCNQSRTENRCQRDWKNKNVRS